MLSAYDLLKGDFQDLVENVITQFFIHAYDLTYIQQAAVESLLTQSKNLADVLKFAFNTPTGIHKRVVYINNNTEALGELDNNLAEVGTLVRL